LNSPLVHLLLILHVGVQLLRIESYRRVAGSVRERECVNADAEQPLERRY
jgi:hypothetical protein